MSNIGTSPERTAPTAFIRPIPQTTQERMRFLVDRLESTQAVADVLGVCRRSVERYLAGQRRTPPARIAERIDLEVRRRWQPLIRRTSRRPAGGAEGTACLDGMGGPAAAKALRPDASRDTPGDPAASPSRAASAGAEPPPVSDGPGAAAVDPAEPVEPEDAQDYRGEAGAAGGGTRMRRISDHLPQNYAARLYDAQAADATEPQLEAIIAEGLHQRYFQHSGHRPPGFEGMLIIGGDGRLLMANDEARWLLDLPADAEGRQVGGLGLNPRLAQLLESGRPVTDEVYAAGDRLLAVSHRPTDRSGGPPGSIATLRDSTELRALVGKIAVARTRLQLLYDAGVRIGNTLDVRRTAEELAKAAVPRFADVTTVELLDPVLQGDEPSGTATMRRIAIQGIGEEHLFIPAGEPITWLPGTSMAASGLESGRAVLVPDLNAVHDWQAQDAERTRSILESGIRSLIAVPLRARGILLGLVVFWRSEPFEADDLSFAEELGARAAVSIDNARRYTREHAMAVTLQRSLLPHSLPEQSALEVAHRYLPAQAGVGGDWFDVVPLSGARVALVVGDVVGHGLHAAATMGRLRTAVHNFSTLDLSPDELLGHLDELVNRIDQDEASDPSHQGITGATCLYAIYDPVSGRCTLARAGHPPPALVWPDGTVEFPDVPVGPPLGLGGRLPFETVELQLPESCRLVLYTDGLIEDRDRDLDVGLELLRSSLMDDGRSPEETCGKVLDSVLPEHPSDDVALLVARTRVLSADRVAEWEVPHEAEAVAGIRADVNRQLERWGLSQEVAFTTELILSELVTNAIRYGSPPIAVRLLRDRSLICEVSDSSSTSPHLRYAATTDEGGRGLFLVAQYAERWGTRYTPKGKAIWTEQSLHNARLTADDALVDTLLDQWEDAAL